MPVYTQTVAGLRVVDLRPLPVLRQKDSREGSSSFQCVLSKYDKFSPISIVCPDNTELTDVFVRLERTNTALGQREVNAATTAY